jgi:hypothetical protein
MSPDTEPRTPIWLQTFCQGTGADRSRQRQKTNLFAKAYDMTQSWPVMSRCPKIRAVVASGLLSAFLCALVLAASPQLHARFHPDANSPNHECAVTLIATGKYTHVGAPIVVVPQSALFLGKIPALAPVWVPAAFQTAHIFEHAPPAQS